MSFSEAQLKQRFDALLQKLGVPFSESKIDALSPSAAIRLFSQVSYLANDINDHLEELDDLNPPQSAPPWMPLALEQLEPYKKPLNERGRAFAQVDENIDVINTENLDAEFDKVERWIGLAKIGELNIRMQQSLPDEIENLKQQFEKYKRDLGIAADVIFLQDCEQKLEKMAADINDMVTQDTPTRPGSPIQGALLQRDGARGTRPKANSVLGNGPSTNPGRSQRDRDGLSPFDKAMKILDRAPNGRAGFTWETTPDQSAITRIRDDATYSSCKTEEELNIHIRRLESMILAFVEGRPDSEIDRSIRISGDDPMNRAVMIALCEHHKLPYDDPIGTKRIADQNLLDKIVVQAKLETERHPTFKNSDRNPANQLRAEALQAAPAERQAAIEPPPVATAIHYPPTPFISDVEAPTLPAPLPPPFILDEAVAPLPAAPLPPPFILDTAAHPLPAAPLPPPFILDTAAHPLPAAPLPPPFILDTAAPPLSAAPLPPPIAPEPYLRAGLPIAIDPSWLELHEQFVTEIEGYIQRMENKSYAASDEEELHSRLITFQERRDQLIQTVHEMGTDNPVQALYQEYIEELNFQVEDYEETLDVLREEHLAESPVNAQATGNVGVYVSAPSRPNSRPQTAVDLPAQENPYQDLPIMGQNAALTLGQVNRVAWNNLANQGNYAQVNLATHDQMNTTLFASGLPTLALNQRQWQKILADKGYAQIDFNAAAQAPPVLSLPMSPQYQERPVTADPPVQTDHYVAMNNAVLETTKAYGQLPPGIVADLGGEIDNELKELETELNDVLQDPNANAPSQKDLKNASQEHGPSWGDLLDEISEEDNDPMDVNDQAADAQSDIEQDEDPNGHDEPVNSEVTPAQAALKQRHIDMGYGRLPGEKWETIAIESGAKAVDRQLPVKDEVTKGARSSEEITQALRDSLKNSGGKQAVEEEFDPSTFDKPDIEGPK